MNSYIGVINKIKKFSDEHLMVKRFGSDFNEQMGNFATMEDSWPILYVVPVAKSIGEFQSTYTVDVYSWDRIMEGRENINNCLSDTDLILTDLFLYFRDGNDYSISVIGEPFITPLNNGLLDYTVGNYIRMDIYIDNYCTDNIPLNIN